MNIIFILIGLSLVVALMFMGAFLWAVRSGQYDDDYTPSVRVLFEEESPAGPTPTASDRQAANINHPRT